MDSGKKILKQYLPDFAVILALLVTTLVSWFPFFQTGFKQTITSFPSFGQDQMHYIARAHSIWLGKKPQDSFVPSESELADGLGNFAEYLFFLPSRLPLLDQLNFPAYFYSVLVFSTLIALMSCYSFFKYLTTSRINSISLSIMFIFCSQFIDLSGLHFPAMPIFSRWPTPMLHYFLIFVLLRVILDKELRYRKIVGSLSLAFGFYLYLYTWQLMLALICAALVMNFFRRNILEIKQIAIIVGFGSTLATPMLIGIADLMLGDRENTLLEFAFRLEETHAPSLGKMTTLLIILLLFMSIMRSRFSLRILDFVFICTLGSVVVSNQQIVTGKLLQPGHFHWYFTAPMLFSIVTIMILSLRKLRRVNCLTAIFLALILSVNQLQVYSTARSEAQLQSRIALSPSQIQRLDDVVFTQNSAVLDQLATSYSGDLLWHSFGIYYEGSEKMASEAVIFSSVWMGAESPIDFSAAEINCPSFDSDPCSTLRMILGSVSGMDWWSYLENRSPVQKSLLNNDSFLKDQLYLAAENPKKYFTKVVSNYGVKSIITSEPATEYQKELMGKNWQLESNDGRFWIYREITS